MPFHSKAEARWLWANRPDVAVKVQADTQDNAELPTKVTPPVESTTPNAKLQSALNRIENNGHVRKAAPRNRKTSGGATSL